MKRIIVIRLLRPDIVVFLLGCLAVLVSIFEPMFYFYFHAPPGTEYRFSDGIYMDYYILISLIYNGMMGYLGFLNRYTEIPQPLSFAHILYPIMGFVSARLGLWRADIVYLVFRILTLLFLFFIVFQISIKLFSQQWSRILVFLFFFTGTSWYTISKFGSFYRADAGVLRFSEFHLALAKFRFEAHHILASSLLLVVGYLATEGTMSLKRLMLIGGIAFLIGMIQPYMIVFGVLALWFTAGYTLFTNRKNTRNIILLTIFLSIVSAIPLLYYKYLYSYVLPFKLFSQMVYMADDTIDFWRYLTANIMYLPFLVILIPILGKLPKLVVFLLSWGAVVPTALFPIAKAGVLIPFWRLMQIQQYIPLSFVAGFACVYVLKNLSSSVRLISLWLLSIIMVSFAALPWYTTIFDSFYSRQQNYYNVFIPKDFLAALEYLRTNSPRESVVLTGEIMSQVTPAFTHNRVILGRADVVNDYGVKIQGLYTMFGPNPDPAWVKSYLTRYRISYILFGVDNGPFIPPYSTYAFLKPVYTKGSVTVVEVIK